MSKATCCVIAHDPPRTLKPKPAFSVLSCSRSFHLTWWGKATAWKTTIKTIQLLWIQKLPPFCNEEILPSWLIVYDIKHKPLSLVGGFFKRPAKIPDTTGNVSCSKDNTDATARRTYARVGLVRHTKTLKRERLPFGNVESLGTRILKQCLQHFYTAVYVNWRGVQMKAIIIK